MEPSFKGKKASYSVSSYFVISMSLALLAILAFIAAATASLTLASFTVITLTLMLALRLWGGFSLSRLEVALACDQNRLFCGDLFTLNADIVNGKILPVWARLQLARPEALAPIASEGVEGESSLLPFEKISGSWSFRAEKRGVHSLGPATLAASDLLDLYRKEKILSYREEVVVYPRLVPIGGKELPFRDYFGIHPSKGIIEDPAWYEGTREYSGNKPAKNIHWKASARLNVLQEKIFEPTSHQKIFFLVDGEGFKRADDRAGFEAALEIAASLASRFAETGASIAVATDRFVKDFPAVLPLGRGPEHLGMVLELLARCDFERGQTLLPLVGGVGHQGAGFVVIARKPGENLKKFYALPATRRDRVMFVFAEEGNIDESGTYPFTTFKALRLRPEAEQ